MSDRTWDDLEAVVRWFPHAHDVYFTATTNGTHAPGSYHYRGEALDVGSKSQARKDELAAWLYTNFSSYLTELIHARVGAKSGWFVKYGVRRGVSYFGSTTVRNHVNHVHAAIATQSKASALLAAVKKHRDTLRKGCSGEQVKLLQTKLHLTADGDFGPGTEAAVKKFQGTHHLSADGIVGSSTWKALG